jgi:hypothetical protein
MLARVVSTIVIARHYAGESRFDDRDRQALLASRSTLRRLLLAADSHFGDLDRRARDGVLNFKSFLTI